MRKKIKWKKGRIETYGDEGARRVKGSLLIEELDLVDETTLIKAMSPAMDWFVAPPNKDGTGGHGGPMIDSHSNEVIGHWDDWGPGTDDETGLKTLDLFGVVHRGPEEFGGEFPQADLAWNKGKAGKWKGLSWGGNKREGYIEFDTKTGEVFGNTITKVLPFEVSIITEGARGPNGMPMIPAVPHSKIMEMASVKGVPGTYADDQMEVSSAIPEEWIANAKERLKWVGNDAEEMAQALYMNSGSKVKEVFGSEITTKELLADLMNEQSKGLLAPDIETTVKESPLAQRFVALRSLETSQKEALSDLQRVLDGSQEVVKAMPIDDDTKKFLEEKFSAIGTDIKALNDEMASIKAKKEEEDEPPEDDDKSSSEKKELLAQVKKLTDAQAETQKSLDAVTKELAEAKKAKKEEEPPEEDEDEPPASNEEEKTKKELEVAQAAQKEAEAKALAATKEADEAKKSVAALSRKVGTPAPQKSRTLLPPEGQAPPAGQGTAINPMDYRNMPPDQKRAAENAIPVTPDKV